MATCLIYPEKKYKISMMLINKPETRGELIRLLPKNEIRTRLCKDNQNVDADLQA